MKKSTITKLYLAAILILSAATGANAQGIMTTWIGDTTSGYSGDGGPANLARLKAPYGVCFDAMHNFYFTDLYNNVIRRVDAITGIIITIAGNGTQGYSGDGSAATNAVLYEPGSLCSDAFGDLYFVDEHNNVIRKVDASTGIITTIAGNGTYGYTGDGLAATTAEINYAGGLCLDASGTNLYFADGINNVIRKISLSSGIITTIAGTGTAGYSGDGGPATAATFSYTTSLCFDPVGNMYISDHDNYVIRKINTTTGIITTVAGNTINGFSGNNGPALSASIGSVYAMCCDGHGDIYIDDWSCSCRKIWCGTGTGIITSQAGQGILSGYNGDGGDDTLEMLCGPVGCCVDPLSGNILIADLGNHSIRRATQPGYIPTSVKKVSALSELNIFPNPSSGQFTIQGMIPQNNTGVEIYNISGELIYSTTFNGTQSYIDISNHAPGIYMINISSENGVRTEKMIIR